jgi:hypothetical protein
MLLFRSLAVGLLAACFCLLAIRPAYEVRVTGAPALVVAPRPQPAATIVDVAPGLGPEQIASLIALAPGERVVAVDDLHVTGDLDAGVMLANQAVGSQRYVDLEVAGAAGSRRVLVLLH